MAWFGGSTLVAISTATFVTSLFLLPFVQTPCAETTLPRPHILFLILNHNLLSLISCILSVFAALLGHGRARFQLLSCYIYARKGFSVSFCCTTRLCVLSSQTPFCADLRALLCALLKTRSARCIGASLQVIKFPNHLVRSSIQL